MSTDTRGRVVSTCWEIKSMNTHHFYTVKYTVHAVKVLNLTVHQLLLFWVELRSHFHMEQ